jgi:N utilization substance protein A
MEVKFDTETIRLITLFEKVTGAKVKDCVVEDTGRTVFFVVDEGYISLAIGKDGSSVKRVENIIKKNVKVVEFSQNLEKFIKNLIPQATEVRAKNIDGKNIVELKVEKANRALVIGRDGKNLKLFKEIAQRIHNIDDIIVR